MARNTVLRRTGLPYSPQADEPLVTVLSLGYQDSAAPFLGADPRMQSLRRGRDQPLQVSDVSGGLAHRVHQGIARVRLIRSLTDHGQRLLQPDNVLLGAAQNKIQKLSVRCMRANAAPPAGKR